MMRGTFQSKDPAEKVTLPFDFSEDLGDATISSVTAAFGLDAGDETGGTTASQNGSITTVGGIAYVPVQDGAAFCDYIVTAKATLSDGRVLMLAGLLPVRTA